MLVRGQEFCGIAIELSSHVHLFRDLAHDVSRAVVSVDHEDARLVRESGDPDVCFQCRLPNGPIDGKCAGHPFFVYPLWRNHTGELR